MTEQRRGFGFAVGAYVSWGLLPLYWKALKPAGAIEVLAHRILWSLIVFALLLTVVRRWSWFRELPKHRRAVGMLSIAGALIAVNWATYIYGVNAGHVVETALGYFINPLFTVLLGVLVLREKLRPAQWAALAVGFVAVLVLAVDYGRPPWIALTLASTFAIYGLIKKTTGAPVIEGMTVEAAVVALPALAYVLFLERSGDATFGTVSWQHTVLMVATGAISAGPLLLFAGAANRVSLTTLGIVQYLAPALQFVIGVFLLHESMPAARWIGFVLVWAALAVFSWDAVRHRSRTREHATV